MGFISFCLLCIMLWVLFEIKGILQDIHYDMIRLRTKMTEPTATSSVTAESDKPQVS